MIIYYLLSFQSLKNISQILIKRLTGKRQFCVESTVPITVILRLPDHEYTGCSTCNSRIMPVNEQYKRMII